MSSCVMCGARARAWHSRHARAGRSIDCPRPTLRTVHGWTAPGTKGQWVSAGSINGDLTSQWPQCMRCCVCLTLCGLSVTGSFAAHVRDRVCPVVTT
eukprot:4118257-Prymnesium_polylepis.1